MVSGLCRVILILLVITAELFEFINNTLKALLCAICLTKPVVFIPDARPVFCIECVTRHPVIQHTEV